MAVSPGLPKAPDRINKKLNGQYLGSKGNRRGWWAERVSRKEGKGWNNGGERIGDAWAASQSDMEWDIQNERKVKALKQNIEEEKQVKL